jgi:hypothetical protein
MEYSYYPFSSTAPNNGISGSPMNSCQALGYTAVIPYLAQMIL